mgnify:CR=1 FL=1
MFLTVLDPVKEYGCAPWPMVEKLIKKCLKENPQERPTSAQVYVWSKFTNILYKTSLYLSNLQIYTLKHINTHTI